MNSINSPALSCNSADLSSIISGKALLPNLIRQGAERDDIHRKRFNPTGRGERLIAQLKSALAAD